MRKTVAIAAAALAIACSGGYQNTAPSSGRGVTVVRFHPDPDGALVQLSVERNGAYVPVPDADGKPRRAYCQISYNWDVYTAGDVVFFRVLWDDGVVSAPQAVYRTDRIKALVFYKPDKPSVPPVPAGIEESVKPKD